MTFCCRHSGPRSIFVPVRKNRNKSLLTRRSPGGQKALKICVTLYPTHYEILNRRCRELRISRSEAVQLLIASDGRDGFLPREVRNCLQARRRGNETQPSNNNNNENTTHPVAQPA